MNSSAIRTGQSWLGSRLRWQAQPNRYPHPNQQPSSEALIVSLKPRWRDACCMGRASNVKTQRVMESAWSHRVTLERQLAPDCGLRWRASFPFAGILSGPDALSDCHRHPCTVAASLIVVLLEGATAGGFVHPGASSAPQGAAHATYRHLSKFLNYQAAFHGAFDHA